MTRCVREHERHSRVVHPIGVVAVTTERAGWVIEQLDVRAVRFRQTGGQEVSLNRPSQLKLPAHLSDCFRLSAIPFLQTPQLGPECPNAPRHRLQSPPDRGQVERNAAPSSAKPFSGRAKIIFAPIGRDFFDER